MLLKKDQDPQLVLFFHRFHIACVLEYMSNQVLFPRITVTFRHTYRKKFAEINNIVDFAQ